MTPSMTISKQSFGAITEVKKQLKPLLKAPKDSETKAEKDKWKRKLSMIKEDLKIAHELAGAETLKA
jgi:hypothetical protein